MPAVNPEILTWARETAGLTLEEAAHALWFKDTKKRTGVERLIAIEAGEEEPSRPVLLNMAKKYRRPLVVFYLQAPPQKGDRGVDFRQAPGASLPAYDPTVDALIRDIRSRQSIVHSLLEDQDSKPLQFIGSARMRNGTAALAASITNKLSFQLNEFRNQRSVEDAFNYLRSCIEGEGIFVLLAGDLGSHHTDIPPELFRGYVIADPLAPLIVINDNDAYHAWSFTALHEVAHLWLGSTGISGDPSVDLQIERFCNDVAGEILLPIDDLQELSTIGSRPYEQLVTQVSNFANERNISRSMVAYNLYRSDVISKGKWRKLKSQFYKEWQETRTRSRSRNKESEGGPNYYVVRRHRIGPALLGLVSRSLSEGIITYTKAGKVLGVKPRNVAPLLRDLSYQGEPL